MFGFIPIITLDSDLGVDPHGEWKEWPPPRKAESAMKGKKAIRRAVELGKEVPKRATEGILEGPSAKKSVHPRPSK